MVDLTAELAEIRRLTLLAAKRGLKVAEAAEVSGIGQKELRALIRSGKIPAVKIGTRKWVIPTAALERYLADASGRLPKRFPRPESAASERAAPMKGLASTSASQGAGGGAQRW